jgi:transposase
MAQEKQQKQRRARRQFTREFKEQAVKLVLEHGKSQTEVGDDLDVHGSVIGSWVKQALADVGKGRPGALTSAEREELAKLRKKVKELEIERTILKKAAAFFAKENG